MSASSQKLATAINRALDAAVLRARGLRILGHHPHPYIMLLNVAVLSGALIGTERALATPGVHPERFVAAFVATYALYERVYLPAKLRITGIAARSLLLDLWLFILPAFAALQALAGNDVLGALDVLGFMLPTMLAIVRVGCFLSGCCYGKHSRVGVLYARAEQRERVGCQRFKPADPPCERVFPIQLFESAGNALIVCGLCVWGAGLAGTGRMFAAYALAYGALRFVLDFWRSSSALRRIGPLSAGQVWACGTVVVVGGVLLASSACSQ